ncbi:MAG: hypothetical protein ACOC6D_00600 [Atribacterota bacterium]
MIHIKKRAKDEFTVKMEEREYKVILDDKYWQELTGGKTSKEELIKKSFNFLLERESKESILSRFDLRIIGRYFPEYDQEIKK